MNKKNLKALFEKIYISSSMNFFHEVFNKEDKPEEALTTSEVFSMEVIYSLGRPTVNQFARYLHLTSPNAAYKVNHLVKKGYLNKMQSQTDKRVFYLEPTEKYMEHYAIHHAYVDRIFEDMNQELSNEEWETLEHILRILEEKQMRAMEEQSASDLRSRKN